MPNHVRQQLREALATAVTGLTTAGARVYQSRLHVLQAANLPCLLVNTDDEQVDALSIHAPALLERQLTASIRCVAKSASDLDDTLDTMAKEVESVLGNTTLSGLAKTVTPTGIAVEMSDDLEKPVGVLTLTYQITYHTAANAPTTAL